MDTPKKGQSPKNLTSTKLLTIAAPKNKNSKWAIVIFLSDKRYNIVITVYDNSILINFMRKTFSLLNLNERNLLLEQLSCDFVNPKSELNFSSPYELLCAVVLSAQTTDEAVNKVTPMLFAKASTPSMMVELGEERIGQIIKTIGLWKAKAGYLAKLSRILAKDYGGEVPDSFDELIKLPGVGSKTAKVVLNVAFNQPTVAVDTHIFRVANRTGFCLGKNAKEVEDRIVPLIEEKFLLKAHHLLLLHGRYVCRAKSPKCDTCSICALCKKNFT